MSFWNGRSGSRRCRRGNRAWPPIDRHAARALATAAAPSRYHGMIRKLPSGGYRLYSRKKNPKTGKRRNLGTFKSRAAAEKHERAVQYYKHG